MKRLVIYRKIPFPNIYIQVKLLNSLKQSLIMSSSPLWILLIGRESAVAWKLSQSPLVENIFVVPGNGGSRHGIPIADYRAFTTTRQRTRTSNWSRSESLLKLPVLRLQTIFNLLNISCSQMWISTDTRTPGISCCLLQGCHIADSRRSIPKDFLSGGFMCHQLMSRLSPVKVILTRRQSWWCYDKCNCRSEHEEEMRVAWCLRYLLLSWLHLIGRSACFVIWNTDHHYFI